MTNMTEAKAWERLPQETDKAYAAFKVYYALEPYGEKEERRSIENVRKKLGLASTTRLGEWSSMHNWPERAMAYDNYMASRAIAVIETSLASYQQAVVDSLSAQLIMLNKIIEQAEKKINEQVEAGELDLTAIKKLAETIRIKDDLARRIGKMPTQFMTEKAEEIEPEERVYTIGG